MIAKLRSYKIQQIEREYGPASHLSKSGTPTMGGILIFISLIVMVMIPTLSMEIVSVIAAIDAVFMVIAFFQYFFAYFGRNKKVYDITN